ncbi:hypothetical protein AB0I81_61090 [Nonomuraea sp. NPDC050404]|uniref:hypothetical protein n=1 Tax=Nonomuraea sp. NPDC050404 TaxID=3155783 RepID=UPI0033D882B8
MTTPRSDARFWLGAIFGLLAVGTVSVSLFSGLGVVLLFYVWAWASELMHPGLLFGGALVALIAAIIASATLMDSAKPCRRGFGIAITAGWAMVVIGVPSWLVVLLYL